MLLSKVCTASSHIRHSLFPTSQIWMFLAYGNGVFFFPYLALLYKKLEFSDASVGLLLGLRPWLTALFGTSKRIKCLLLVYRS